MDLRRFNLCICVNAFVYLLRPYFGLNKFVSAFVLTQIAGNTPYVRTQIYWLCDFWKRSIASLSQSLHRIVKMWNLL